MRILALLLLALTTGGPLGCMHRVRAWQIGPDGVPKLIFAQEASTVLFQAKAAGSFSMRIPGTPNDELIERVWADPSPKPGTTAWAHAVLNDRAAPHEGNEPGGLPLLFAMVSEGDTTQADKIDIDAGDTGGGATGDSDHATTIRVLDGAMVESPPAELGQVNLTWTWEVPGLDPESGFVMRTFAWVWGLTDVFKSGAEAAETYSNNSVAKTKLKEATKQLQIEKAAEVVP